MGINFAKIKERLEPKIYTSSDGTVREIRSMSIRHISNALDKIDRSGEEHPEYKDLLEEYVLRKTRYEMKGMWVTGAKKAVLITDLKDDHLNNIINKMEKYLNHTSKSKWPEKYYELKLEQKRRDLEIT